MARRLRLSSLIPVGVAVESVAESDRKITDHKITVMAHSAVQEKACPLCGRCSRRVHSQIKLTGSAQRFGATR